MNIVIIDMAVGNVGSVLEAFRRVGAVVEIARAGNELAEADMVILPGVGAFGDGMRSLEQQKLIDPLRRFAADNRGLLLGICLGMQLLAERGFEYGEHRGLGLIRGSAVRLQAADPSARVPNVGWRDVTVTRPSTWLGEMRTGSCFYFAHSYWLEPSDSNDVAATFDHGVPNTAAVESKNVVGVQFHPEKSQDAGLDLLASMVHKMSVRRTPAQVVC